MVGSIVAAEQGSLLCGLPRKASSEPARAKVSITVSSSSKLQSCLIKWWSMRCTVIERLKRLNPVELRAEGGGWSSWQVAKEVSCKSEIQEKVKVFRTNRGVISTKH